MRPLYSWPSWVSEPASPAGVTANARRPSPRVRVGFQGRAVPVSGSMAAMPGAVDGAAGLVAVGVVEPPQVPADVDGGCGDGYGVEGVAAGVVDPGRVVQAGAGQLEPDGGIAGQEPVGGVPSRDRDEV